MKNGFAQYFPETAYVGFKGLEDKDKMFFYTIVRNRAYTSINYLFQEQKLIDHKNATLNFIKHPMSFPLQFQEHYQNLK